MLFQVLVSLPDFYTFYLTSCIQYKGCHVDVKMKFDEAVPLNVASEECDLSYELCVACRALHIYRLTCLWPRPGSGPQLWAVQAQGSHSWGRMWKAAWI